MILKHFTVTIDATAGNWNGIITAINESSEAYTRPFSVIFQNKSAENAIITIYSKKEYDEDDIGGAGTPRYRSAQDGLLLKAGGQLQLTQLTDIYYVEVTHEANATASQLVISCLHYGEIQK